MTSWRIVGKQEVVSLGDMLALALRRVFCLITEAKILSRGNSPCESFGVLGGLHAIYTVLDLRNPRRLVPVDPSVAQAMANSALRLPRGGTDMWRAWIGFNLSHSLGLLLFAALAAWAGFRVNTLPVGMMPVLSLIGCIYLVLAMRYWFRIPAINNAVVGANGLRQAAFLEQTLKGGKCSLFLDGFHGFAKQKVTAGVV